MTQLCALGLACFSVVVFAEEKARQLSTYVYDANGARVAAGASTETRTDGETRLSERAQSVNGRSVPLETVEERVLSDDSSGRIVERVVQRYDSNGLPSPAERIRIEERKTAAGVTTTRSVFRGDLNGRMTLAERSSTVSEKSGDAVKSETVIEGMGLSGSLEIIEKRTSQETATEKASNRESVTYRRNPNGGFYVAARETMESQKRDGGERSTVVSYNAAATGKLEFAGQTVHETEKRDDGSEVTVVSIYGVSPPGRAIPGSASQPSLREQQLIERLKGPGGTMVERFSVSRPDLSDNRPGTFELVSEVVCTGDCEDPPAPEKSQPPSEPPAATP